MFRNVMGIKSQKHRFSLQTSDVDKTAKHNNVQLRARGLHGIQARLRRGCGQILSCSGFFVLGGGSYRRWSQSSSPGNRVLCASPRQCPPPGGSSRGSTWWPGGLLELGPPVGPCTLRGGLAVVCSVDPGKLWGLKQMGKEARGVQLASPPLPWLMREGPFVYQDKEEIEKFLRG